MRGVGEEEDVWSQEVSVEGGYLSEGSGVLRRYALLEGWT